MHKSRDIVVTAIKKALDEAGIEIPFPYRTLTFKEPLPLSNHNDNESV
jgi:small-conductance mechanosensitive channel